MKWNYLKNTHGGGVSSEFVWAHTVSTFSAVAVKTQQLVPFFRKPPAFKA